MSHRLPKGTRCKKAYHTIPDRQHLSHVKFPIGVSLQFIQIQKRQPNICFSTSLLVFNNEIKNDCPG